MDVNGMWGNGRLFPAWIVGVGVDFPVRAYMDAALGFFPAPYSD